MCKYTPIIRQMIMQNKAYVVITKHGSYVCAHGHKVQTTCVPLKYVICNSVIANDTDFLLWMPYQHGLISPWGTGHPTLNVKIIKL